MTGGTPTTKILLQHRQSFAKLSSSSSVFVLFFVFLVRVFAVVVDNNHLKKISYRYRNSTLHSSCLVFASISIYLHLFLFHKQTKHLHNIRPPHKRTNTFALSSQQLTVNHEVHIIDSLGLLVGAGHHYYHGHHGDEFCLIISSVSLRHAFSCEQEQQQRTVVSYQYVFVVVLVVQYDGSVRCTDESHLEWTGDTQW